MSYQELAKILKAVAEPNRLEILEMLSCGEMCACDILEHFDFTQPTLSHHMKVLENYNLIKVRKDSKWHYYKLNNNVTTDLVNYLNDIFDSEKKKCICKN